ncbi:MAG TPA: GNAT family N-acetyltransferase, partial [Wenzhouxiangella sp.]|nr:GNAT family N-acetyltransferase [Wenzhouxiangella sp.]
MSKASASDLQWRVLKFNELPARLLYRIMAARQAVFVVEQQCVYQDLDGLDECAVHVCALAAGKLYAYARILPPQKRFEEPSIGR